MDKGKTEYINDIYSFWEVLDNFRENINEASEFLNIWLRLHLVEILSKHRDILSFWPEYEIGRDGDFEVYDTIVNIVTNLVTRFADYGDFEIPISSENIQLSILLGKYKITLNYDKSSYEDEGLFATIEIVNINDLYDSFFITMHKDGSIFISEDRTSSSFAWITPREYTTCFNIELLRKLDEITVKASEDH